MTLQLILNITILCGFVAVIGLWLMRCAMARPLRGASDVAVYKAQMRALEKDKLRGVIDADAFEGMRAETARRLLKATQVVTTSQSRRGGVAVLTGMAGVCALGASAVYLDLGAGTATDMGLDDRITAAADLRQTRSSQAEVEAQIGYTENSGDESYASLVADLRAALKDRPDDVRGLALLAQAETRLGNLPQAHAAQAELVALKGDAVTTDDLLRLAEMRIVAAGGFVTPEAEQTLQTILNRTPKTPLARFRMGTLYDQIGRPDLAFRIWARLVDEGHDSQPFMPLLRAEMPRVAQMAGRPRYALPQVALAGPTQLDIEAASGMSAQDRQAMIEGMVTSLGGRLAENGGTAQEWAQLITALTVLGRSDQANAIFAEARTVFASDPSGLNRIETAATKAGLTP